MKEWKMLAWSGLLDPNIMVDEIFNDTRIVLDDDNRSLSIELTLERYGCATCQIKDYDYRSHNSAASYTENSKCTLDTRELVFRQVSNMLWLNQSGEHITADVISTYLAFSMKPSPLFRSHPKAAPAKNPFGGVYSNSVSPIYHGKNPCKDIPIGSKELPVDLIAKHLQATANDMAIDSRLAYGDAREKGKFIGEPDCHCKKPWNFGHDTSCRWQQWKAEQ